MRHFQSGCLVLFLLPFLFMIGVMDVLVVGAVGRQLATMFYRSVPGTLARSEVTGHGGSYHLEVRYTYEIDGRAYEGTRYRAFDIGFSDAQVLDEQRARLPSEGSSVQVFYRAEDPKESVLAKGMEALDLLTLLSLTPFNAFIVGALYAVVRSWKKVFEGVHSFVRDGRTHARLVTLTPAESGFLGASLASAVALVGVGAVWGGVSAPLPVAVLAWVAVLGSGVFTAMRRRAQWKAGDYDLIVDPRDRSVSLPPIFGRRRRVEVAWSQIQFLGVEPGSIQDRKGKAGRPVLRFIDDGKLRSEALGNWLSSNRGQEVVSWLESRIARGSPAVESLNPTRSP